MVAAATAVLFGVLLLPKSMPQPDAHLEIPVIKAEVPPNVLPLPQAVQSGFQAPPAPSSAFVPQTPLRALPAPVERARPIQPSGVIRYPASSRKPNKSSKRKKQRPYPSTGWK
jgi:hypothetical protein